MKLFYSLLFSFLLGSAYAQNIGGVINIYAAVTGVAGSNITVTAAAGFAVGDQIMIIQMKGAAVVTTNNNTYGNVTAMGGAGTYEFKDITAVVGNVITVNSAPTNAYNTATGATQIVRVPKYCQPTVTSSLNCTPWNGTIGGVLAFEAGTLTLNSDIDVNASGFRGGNFIVGAFCCSNGSFVGLTGGQKGEGISNWVVGADRMKGKQANAGGGSNCGNSGGGGGGNFGPGGLGGNQYNGCAVFDDRGVGGIGLAPSFASLFMGGGGGGGFKDNNQVATAGGKGGGIIYIKANQIICNNRVIAARGESITVNSNGEGAGGGGAGGTIFIACNNYVGNLTVNTSGGNGGSNFNTIFPGNCHGPGGGGGGGLFAFSGAAMPLGITYISTGGPAGLVTNPVSTCFNTTYGAGPGIVGSSLANLPTPVLSYTPPPITITGNNSLCAGQQTTLTANTTATGVTTYTWNTGPTTPTISLGPLVTTVYTVTGTNNTCTATATQTVYMGIGPPINVVGNNTICSTQSTTLTASGATTYTWSSGSTNTVVTLAPNVTTTYTVIGSSTSCTSTALFTVTVTPTPTLTTIGTYSFCDTQGSATISASGATNYTWSPSLGLNNTNTSLVTANPAVTSTYVLEGYNGVCTSSISVTVQNFSVPIVSAITSASFICSGNSAVLSATGGNTYDWQPSAGISNNTSAVVNVSPIISTNYTVVGTSVNGCTSTATSSVIVVQSPSTFLTALKSNICRGSQTTLFASGATNYVWSPAGSLSSSVGSTVTASPLATQLYTVVGTNGIAPNTCSNSHTILLTVTPTATVTIVAPDSICLGQTAPMFAYGGTNYTWTPNSFLDFNNVFNPIATPTLPMVYSVTGAAEGGLCPGTQTISVYVNPNPIVDAGRDTSINFDEFTYLNGTGDGWLYTWSSSDMSSINCINCPNTYIKPTANTCYVLEVQNSHGCISKDEVCVELRKEFALYIPNSFTPNGDGVNDIFKPLGYGIIDLELTIFNRWGQLLFSAKGSFVEGNFVQWDGKFKGKTCEQGTYIYKFVYTTASRKTETKTGPLNILSPTQDN
ncbi:MAG: gliding motility-associated C-terminal domain-containing protein [Bacteroidota bacterium]|nr:gliding motility-associated C-terminal domain-containing protein [Bacteroidota bacterium]